MVAKTAAKIGSEILDYITKPEGVRGLLFAHNTSPQKLAREAQMGGSPMPSIAVTKEGVPFDNFGNITLVGNPRNFDPAITANKAFSSDAYTVRAPSPIQMAKKNAYKQFAEDFAEYDELGSLSQVKYALEALERKGGVNESNFEDFSRFFQGGPTVKAKFLDDKGVNIRDVDGNIDFQKVNKEFTGLNDQFGPWARKQAQKYVEPEQYFIANPDRDYVTGRPKLVEYTADNVANWMSKRGGKNQEMGIGQKGVAAQRASESRQLRSIKDIQSLRDSIVDEATLEAAKKATDGKFFELAEKLKGSYKYAGDGFRYLDEVGEMIIGMNDRNAQKMLREYGFDGASPEIVKEINDYRKMLQNSPVGYMESKPQRVVSLNEYVGAVVPENIDQQTKKLLQDSGLEIKTYNPDMPQTRTQARDTFRNQMFQVSGLATGGILGALGLPENATAADLVMAGKEVPKEQARAETQQMILDALLGFMAPTPLGDATMDAYNRNRTR